ncbi:MAG: B12-binding domain-containing radical SAM protein [Candidatus Scalindua sp.]
MNILVLNPLSRFAKNVVRDVLYGAWCKGKRIGGGTVPPFELLRIATILRDDGNEVKFLDAQAEQRPFDDVLEIISNIDVLIISTSVMSFREDADTLLEFKEINSRMKTIIIGSHPTFMPKHSLAHEGVDIIVRHEPEFILRDLVRCFRAGNEDWKCIEGIGFIKNGNVVLNREHKLIEDLDELPFPDVTMLNSKINYFNPIVRRMPFVTTATSKGCPALCRFCPAPYFDGTKVRFQSADYVIREVEYFIKHGYREVYFRDDTFFVNKKRDMIICHEIVRKNLDITWLANARVNMIDKDMMERAKAAGCHTIKFGIESGVQHILDKMKKGYQIEQAYKVFEWLHEVGINTHTHVMIGNPGDTVETVNRTIEFVKELDPTTATFTICTPYPGTPMFDEVVRKFPDIGDGTLSDLSKLHVEGLFNEHYANMSREEVEMGVKRAYRAFYLRPTYFLKTLKQIRSIDDIKRISIAATNILDFSIRGE